MQDQIARQRLLERRAERLDELVGKLADEADRVGQQVVAAAGAQQPGGRIERVEQPVADADGRAGQRVQKRGLAGVRVAGERHRRQVGALALGPHHRAVRADVDELALERRDPVAGQPPVGLDLRLARSSGTDAAVDASRAEALEVRPQAAHAGEVVLELRELDLELALGAVGVRGEDVEDDRGAVDHREAERRLEVSLLPGRELVVARRPGWRPSAAISALSSSSLPCPR